MMKILQNTIRYAFIFGLIYGAFILSFVWWHCYQSQFKGGKNGALDAYRHTLASAMVAYTTSPKVVRLVTVMMERGNLPANLMDQHNNAIGAKIGSHASSITTLTNNVQQAVYQGSINAKNAQQITFLPVQYWQKSLFW